ncbi:MAG: hypothetical protein HGB26_06140 [Desulfobulbaceae bacterium]|nr:hypothetical protein [Desulfobulbaceae bacterium]
MTDEQPNNSVVKIGNASIEKYSNELIRRGLDELGLQPMQMISPDVSKKKVFVIGGSSIPIIGTVTAICISGELGFPVTILGYEDGLLEKLKKHGVTPIQFNHLNLNDGLIKIYDELAKDSFDMIIVAYWSYVSVIPEIRNKYPNINIVFLNSYSSELTEFALKNGADVFSVPFDSKKLLERIKEMLSY